MRAASAAGSERTMRHRAVRIVGRTAAVERPTVVVVGQPGDLRADRHPADDCDDTSPRDWNVKAMNLDYPFRFDGKGRTADTADDDHIRDLIEQVLFTAPGERVNRPEFGSGVQRLVFAPNGQELASATQFLVQGALQQWLGDLIEVNEVRVDSDDATLTVLVQYTVRRTQQTQTAEFTRGGTL
jgi:phage baseplate assembly protein W